MWIIPLIVALVVVSVVALVTHWWTWKPVVKQRVLLQTDSDVTFAGVVLSRRGQLLVLGNVTISAAGQSHHADGVVIVERSRVMWMQVA